jgi:uroporphyrinogen decarboxylase
MRQAGRSLPEYRAIRGTGSILQAIAQPDLVTEITLQPVRRYGVDAAILYSDIMVPLWATGFGVDIKPGVGPVIDEPFRSADDLQRIRPLDAATDTPFVLDAVKTLVGELDVPLIGFAGAPFTLASYLIEGGPSKNYARTKALMHAQPDVWHQLVTRLADLSAASLQSQIDAGCEAVQLFDSWAGSLSRADYETFALPATRRVFESVDTDVPRIHFGVGTGELLSTMATSGADVIGIDWRVPLPEARTRVDGRPVQGNLDPTVCFAPWSVVERQVDRVLAEGGGRGHVFNLGHGVLPETDPDVLARVVERVHQFAPDGE